MKPRFVYRLEYFAFRAVLAPFAALPRGVSYVLAWPLARAAFALAASRRREAVRRIRQVFGEGTGRREAERIAWQSFLNVAFNAVDMVWGHGGRGKRRIGVDNEAGPFETVRRWREENPGSGVIFAAPHSGNWELASFLAPRAGIPVFTFTGLQHNPFVTDYLLRLRQGDGVELIPKGDTTMLRKAFANFRAGKGLALLVDLRDRNPGIAVPFLGGTANLYPGMALFAVQMKAPVFLAVMHRRWTHHTMELHGPFRADPSLPKAEAMEALTRQVMEIVEEDVRNHPGQWFWFNKRWILDPP